MRLARRLLPLALAFPLAFAACGDDEPEPRRSILVTGDIENRTGELVPNDAFVVVAWALDDSTYIHGTGSISNDGNSFRVELDAPPPEEALYHGVVGIGLIVAVAGTVPDEGDPLEMHIDGAIGAVGDYAIIYVHDRDAVPEGAFWWLPNMPDGYGLGVGVEREGELFEGFDEVDPDEAELIIDDLDNIHVVNWS